MSTQGGEGVKILSTCLVNDPKKHYFQLASFQSRAIPSFGFSFNLHFIGLSLKVYKYLLAILTLKQQLIKQLQIQLVNDNDHRIQEVSAKYVRGYVKNLNPRVHYQSLIFEGYLDIFTASLFIYERYQKNDRLTRIHSNTAHDSTYKLIDKKLLTKI